jgi:ABC-type transporter Mla MlaB component
MNRTKYNVIGGEYADTTFTSLAPGAVQQRFGPLPHDEAVALWRSLSAKSVDNCMIRYYVRAIEEEDDEQWFVVGGEYADTSFSKMAPEQELEVYGPYQDRQQALAVWRAITSKTVDDAHHRYDIVDIQRLDQMKKQG